MLGHFTTAAHFNHTASDGEEEGQRSATSSPGTSSVSLEDIGFPPDGLWDHNAAYEQRFCYDHGESEYLLGTDNRWMLSTDFEIRDAEVILEAMLQKHKDDPSPLEPHTRRCQAECHGNLLSHVHSVIDSRKHGDLNLYLIEWKACWTPEGNIGNKTWIGASLKVNKNVSCRRSTRVENGFEDRKRRFENMMLAMNIKRWPCQGRMGSLGGQRRTNGLLWRKLGGLPILPLCRSCWHHFVCARLSVSSSAFLSAGRTVIDRLAAKPC